MLAWQEDLPRFVVKGFAGDRMILFFGLTNVDDVEISEFHFIVQLSENQGSWSLETQWHRYGDPSRKPRLGKFLSKLHSALGMHQDFDFNKYLGHWSEEDKHFAGVLINTIGSRKEYKSIF
jgi:hypothetical protein